MSVVPDVSTAKGRNNIKSIAYSVRRAKTILDGLGKDLVADWKAKAKVVDEGRKKTRDFLDALSDEARRPLTEYEEAEAARQKAEQEAKEMAEAWDAALLENDLFDRMAEIKRKEAEIAAKEAEAAAKAEADRKAAEAKAEAERLAANKKHQAAVNNEALADLVKIAGINEDMGKNIIKAIASKQIKHVTINY